MTVDLTLPARKAILRLLKADPRMTALVAASSIYPQSPPAEPEWPFVKYGAPTAVPIRASCVAGSTISVAIHGFGKGRTTGGVLIESAEDHAGRIGAAITQALGGVVVGVAGVGRLKLRVESSLLRQDGSEKDAYHVTVNVRGRFLGPA